LRLILALLITLFISKAGFAKQKTQLEIELLEIQAKFKEEQPGYIAELGVFEGEMQAAFGLYQLGRVKEAKVHLSHADVIIYRRLLNRVLARRAVGFSGELAAFTKAINDGKSVQSVQQKHFKLIAAIAASRGQEDLIAANPMVTAASVLMRKSADYFTSGVANGYVVEPTQFQDAWGFMKACKSILADVPKSERKKNATVFLEMDATLKNLSTLWSKLNSEDINNDGSQILSDAATKIEAQLSLINQP
jgi:hypothetical protein